MLDLVQRMLKLWIILAVLIQSSFTIRCPPPPTSGLYTCRNRSLFEVPLPIGAPIKNRLAITALDISDNSIQILHQDALRPYPALKCLRIERNRLWKITDLAFQAVPNLQRLLLRSNNLLIQPGSLSPKALLQLSHLRELDLSENPVGQLVVGFFPPSLNILRIERTIPGLLFQPGALGEIFELESLSLGNNSFENLPSHLDAELRSLKYLRRLQLEGNRWNCDCHLSWLARLCRDFNASASCHSPKELKNRDIATLPPVEFQCAPMALNKRSASGENIADVEVGSTITMICQFYSEPRGKIRWFKGKEDEGFTRELITQGVEEKVTGDFLTSTNLTLNEVREGLEDGVYRCEAENARGKDEIVFRLRVGYQESKRMFGLRTKYGLALISALVVIGGVMFISFILLGVVIYCCRRNRAGQDAPRRIVIKEETNSIAYSQGLQLDAPGIDESISQQHHPQQFSGVVHYHPTSPILNWFCAEETNGNHQY